MQPKICIYIFEANCLNSRNLNKYVCIGKQDIKMESFSHPNKCMVLGDAPLCFGKVTLLLP